MLRCAKLCIPRPEEIFQLGPQAIIRLVRYSLQADRLNRTFSVVRCQGGVVSLLPG
jgi:hypothetical protein